MIDLEGQITYSIELHGWKLISYGWCIEVGGRLKRIKKEF